jgi:hypothetical protein
VTTEDFIIETGGDIEPGTYPCILTGLERIEITSDGTYQPEGEIVPLLRWTWTTDDNLVIEGTTSFATGPRSKMRAWMAGIGIDIGKPHKLRLADLLGRDALVSVILNDSGFATIQSIVAAPKARPSGKE